MLKKQSMKILWTDVGSGVGVNGVRAPRTCLCPLFACLFVVLALRAPTPTKASAIPLTLRAFRLTGDLSGERASFTPTAVARVENSKGGSIELIAGNVALPEMGVRPKWQLR